jgi:hypothetical protein
MVAMMMNNNKNNKMKNSKILIIGFLVIGLISCHSIKDNPINYDLPTTSSNLDGQFVGNASAENLGVYYRPANKGYFALLTSVPETEYKIISGVYQAYATQSEIDTDDKFVVKYHGKEVELYAENSDDRFYEVGGDYSQTQKTQSEISDLIKNGQISSLEVSYYKNDTLQHIEELSVPDPIKFIGLKYDWDEYASLAIISRSNPVIDYEVDPNNENGILFMLAWTGSTVGESFDDMMDHEDRSILNWNAYYEEETGSIRIPDDVLNEIPTGAQILVGIKRNDANHFEDKEADYRLIHFMISTWKSEMAVLVD